jgi:hypothetical protein
LLYWGTKQGVNMVTCANCSKTADYTHADPGVNPVHYCAVCLPVWLRKRASLGHFPLVSPVVVPDVPPVAEDVTKPTQTSAKKKATPKE